MVRLIIATTVRNLSLTFSCLAGAWVGRWVMAWVGRDVTAIMP